MKPAFRTGATFIKINLSVLALVINSENIHPQVGSDGSYSLVWV